MRRLLLCALLLAGCFDLDRLRAPADTGAPPPTDGAPPTDGGGPSRCATLGAQLCDGFEGAMLDPRWTRIERNGNVSLAPVPYRGAQSLKVHGDAAGGADVQVEISETETFPATQIFMRGFVLLPASTPMTPIRLMTAYQPDPPYTGVSLYVTPAPGGFAPRVYDGVTDTTYDTAMSGSPTGRWVCLEWELVEGNPGSVRVWVDDTEYSDLALALDTSTAPPFGVISFGLLHPPGTPAQDLWMDEIAVNNARIGCAR